MAIVGNAEPIADSQRMEDLADRTRYWLKYRVITDSATDGPRMVLQAPGLPTRYSSYSTGVDTADAEALLISRIPNRVRSTHLMWHVECMWDTRADERLNNDPLLELPVIEWDFEPYQEPLPGFTTDALYASKTEIVTKDANGTETTVTKPAEFVPDKIFGVVNSAGDPFDPPPTRDAAHPIVTFTRNEEVFDSAFALLFNNSVNNAAWSGLEPRQARVNMRAVSQQEEIDGTLHRYWRVTYIFRLRFETHDIKLLNIGPRYYKDPSAATPDKRRIKFAADGEGANALGLLKADGGRLVPAATADAPNPTASGPPTFIRYRPYRETSFTLLNIDLLTPLSGLRNRTRNPLSF